MLLTKQIDTKIDADCSIYPEKFVILIYFLFTKVVYLLW